jgi:hypothetical protein
MNNFGIGANVKISDDGWIYPNWDDKKIELGCPTGKDVLYVPGYKEFKYKVKAIGLNGNNKVYYISSEEGSHLIIDGNGLQRIDNILMVSYIE